MRHVPVLLPQTLSLLRPRSSETYIDATFGAGGYARAILDAAPGCRVVAIDRDPAAIAAGAPAVAAARGRLQLVNGRFSALEAIARTAGAAPADGIVLDVGVSSMQLEDAKRGFSFQADGPLDMRMQPEGATAADVVNSASEADLARILHDLGEERSARAIARHIVARRRERPFLRTLDLAQSIVRTLGRERIAGRHAATRTFQALRIYINEELEELSAALLACERVLKAGGRLIVVTFHSLEDAIVKRFLKQRAAPPPRGSRHLPSAPSAAPPPSFQILNQRPITPSPEEIEANWRARSAKLRGAVRTDAPPWPATDAAR
jgi:16S rRNA (cytosine1402-N4)-methyltransferase